MNYSNRGNFLSQIPPVTRNLLIINVALWLVIMICGNASSSLRQFADFLVNHLGLHFWESELFNPAQFVSYMFVHDPSNPMHILFNMFTLWMFGRMMEQVWGSARFLVFYMICGLGAALVQELVWHFTWMHDLVSRLAVLNGTSYEAMDQIVLQGLANHSPDAVAAVKMFQNNMVTIGASGAIFGVLLGFAFMFPNLPLYLFFIPVPIKAKYMVIGYGVLEFFLGVSQSDSSVAHFAHLGGMLFGLILLLYWKHKGTLTGGRRF